MHIEKDRKTGNYGNCPKCIHIKYSSYPQVIHIGWITYVNHVYRLCKDVRNRKRGIRSAIGSTEIGGARMIPGAGF